MRENKEIGGEDVVVRLGPREYTDRATWFMCHVNNTRPLDQQ